MEFYKSQHSNPTKPKRGMGFFGKQRKRSSGRSQQQNGTTSAGGGVVEARTDASRKDQGQAKDSGLREINDGGPQHHQQQQQQQQQHVQAAPKKKGMQALLKSPSSRSSDKDINSNSNRQAAAPSPRSRYHRTTDSGSTAGSNLQNQSPKHASSSSRPKPDGRTTSSQHRSQNGAAGAAKQPQSILNRNPHFNPSAAASASPTAGLSAYNQRPAPPAQPATYDFHTPPSSYNPNRVRFMSSEQSVASTEASGVHLMAGGANSVASSSAMSSSHDRENVFDRVLNMVMAEEHERLNAMGMSATPDPKSDAARQKQAHSDRFLRADAKARAVVAALGDSKSGSDDDLGLLPPKRSELAPIDMDTGLEIGGSNEAPIDVDTGLEIGEEIAYHDGGENEYHDANDDAVEEERWKRLTNETALTGGMKRLSVNDAQRCRSEPNASMADPRNHHHRYGSDPEKIMAGGKSGSSRLKSAVGKKSKKFWDKNSKQQFVESDEWVAFDNQGQQQQQARYNNNGRGSAMQGGYGGGNGVNDLASF
jgi:hypothetical protein